MNRKAILMAMAALLLVLSAVEGLTGVTLAIANGYTLSWWTVDGGGTFSSGGDRVHALPAARPAQQPVPVGDAIPGSRGPSGLGNLKGLQPRFLVE